MVEVERRQAALWTVGRGARGLLCCSDRYRNLIVAGTALANNGNKIHILSFDSDAVSLSSLNVLSAPSEIWSHEVVNKDTNLNIIAATRKGQRSAVEVWSLLDADDLSPKASQPRSWDTSDFGSPPIRNTSFMAVDGNILKVLKNPSTASSYLSLTTTGAAHLKVGTSLQIGTCLQFDPDNLLGKGEKDSFVDGGWVDEMKAYIASRSYVGMCDMRTGTAENVLDTRKAISAHVSMSDRLRISAHPTRTSTAHMSSENHLIVGGEDGSLRAYDWRAPGIIWQAESAHAQWVSTICTTKSGGVLSGGMDGVVRFWTSIGEAIATFPQHDDFVTNAITMDSTFVTMSYDGRIAFSQLPAVA